MIFRERLWPSVWLIVAGLLLVPAVLLVFAPISMAVAIPAALGSYALFLLFLFATAPQLVVTETALRAGRAQVSREFISAVSVESRPSTKTLLTTGADARAFLLIRSWIPESVRVNIADANDPTPYWLISSRRAHQLAQSLERPRLD